MLLISWRKTGAGDGIRTHDPNLGKVTATQLRAELSKSQIAGEATGAGVSGLFDLGRMVRGACERRDGPRSPTCRA